MDHVLLPAPLPITTVISAYTGDIAWWTANHFFGCSLLVFLEDPAVVYWPPKVDSNLSASRYCTSEYAKQICSKTVHQVYEPRELATETPTAILG